MVEQLSGVLEARVVKGEFLWTIKNFSLLDQRNGEYVSSEPFSLVGSGWVLELYPHGLRPEQRDTVSVYLSNVLRGNVTVRFVMNVVDSKRNELTTNSSQRQMFDAKTASWGYGGLISRSTLPQYLENDTLRVLCSLERSEIATPPVQTVNTDVFKLGVCTSLEKLLECSKHRSIFHTCTPLVLHVV